MTKEEVKKEAHEAQEEQEEKKSPMEEAAEYEGDPLDCPCIQHMKEGPCGGEFVDAYRCFLDSKEEEKGSDCIELFKAMQTCFFEHPEEYGDFIKKSKELDEEEEAEQKAKEAKEAEVKSTESSKDEK